MGSSRQAPTTTSRSERGELYWRGTPIYELTREQLIVAVEAMHAALIQRAEVIAKLADVAAKREMRA